MIDPSKFSFELDIVRKQPKMFRVMRNGSVMQVSKLMEGDEPREPDSDGF